MGSLGKSFLKRTMYVVRLFPVMMNVTARIINMIPQISRGVSLSSKMVTPKNTAVTGSSAPKACPKSFSHGKPPKTHNRKPNWHDTTPKPAYR